MTGMHNIDNYLGRLLQMKNLLSDPLHWHRGDLHNPDKTAFCIAGAARYTERGSDVNGRLTVPGAHFYEWLQTLVPPSRCDGGLGNFGDFNDYAASHSVIMEWLDLCIGQRLREIDYCVEIEHDDIITQNEFPWRVPDFTEKSLEQMLIEVRRNPNILVAA